MSAAASDDRSRDPAPRAAAFYVALGLLVGGAYALLNTQTDDWAREGAGSLGRAFASFHAFVDRGIPALAGALLGLAVHWGHLRARLARAEAARADELRSRLRHVERDQAVWVVVAAALHELKNPLHTLGLLVDELVSSASDGEAPSRLAPRIRAQMDRTLVPLDALRSLARPGLAPRDARSALATVDEVVAGMTPLASEAGVDLRLSASRGGRARVDAEYLRIILDNLLANALEGRGDGARARRVHVTVSEESLQAKGARVTITVSDDGPGLDGERARSLFEPLRTDKVGGLGLGLPIARALARTMGGELTKADVPGFMTSFVLELPSEPIA